MANKRWSEAVREYVEFMRRKRGPDNATARADLQRLMLMQRLMGSDRVLMHITPQHFYDLFYGPGGLRDDHETTSSRGPGGGRDLEPPVSDSTNNLYRSRLMVFMRWCKQRGYVKREAEDLLSMVDKAKIQKKSRKRIDADTLVRLPEVAKNLRDKCYLVFVSNTAVRQNEAIRIKVSQVNLEEGVIENVVISKTGDVDTIPITSELDSALREWLTEYAQFLERPFEADDHLFPNRIGGGFAGTQYNDTTGEIEPVRVAYQWRPKTPMTMNVTVSIVKNALKELGLDTHYEGTHTIRRSTARAYYDAVASEGGDVAALRETSALLHHAYSSTTEVYLGLDLEREKRDRRMKGKPFLSALVVKDDAVDNVVPLRRTSTGE